MSKQFRILLPIAFVMILAFAGCVSTADNEAARREAEATADTHNKVAWTNLLANDWSAAEQSFKHILDTGAYSGRAYRGLALAEFASEYDLSVYPSLIAALEKEPGSPQTAALLYLAKTEFLRGNTQIQAFLPALEKAVLSPQIPSWLKREYREALFFYYSEVEGLGEESFEVKADMYLLENWSFLGPFSNISGSGYKTDFVDIAAQEGPGFSGYGTGLNNWKLEPFERKLPSPGLDEKISSYFSDMRYVSLYGYKSVFAEDSGEYTFVFSRQGSIEAWLDGTKILEDGDYIKCDNGFYFRTKLEKGQHHLYVKLNNREAASSFSVAMFRSTDQKPELSSTYVKIFPDADLYDPFLNALCQEVDSGDNIHESRFWLAFMLNERGRYEAAMSIVSDSIYDDSLLIGWLKAKICENLDDFSAYEQRMLAMAENEAFFAPAREYALNNFLSNDRLEKAGQVIGELKSTHENWIHAMEAELVLNFKKQHYNEALESYDAVVKKFGESAAGASLSIFLSMPELSRMQADRYLSIFADNGHYKQALFLRYKYFRNRNPLMAFAILSEYLTLYDANDDTWFDYIQLMYEDSSKPYGSIKDKTVELALSFPFCKSLLSEQYNQDRMTYNNYENYARENPDVLKGTSASKFKAEMDKAETDYRNGLARYVSYFPETLRIRDQLREVDKKPLIYEDCRPKDSFDIIEGFDPTGLDLSQSDAVLVYDDRKELYFGDGAYTVFEHYILKVLSSRGVEDNRYQYLEFHPAFGKGSVDEAFLLKVDGSRIYADRSGRKLAFPGLSSGDCIVVRYRVDGYMTGEINNEVWTSCELAGQYPVSHMKFQLVTPKEMNVERRFNNIDETSVSLTEDTYLDDFSRISIEVANQPGVEVGLFPLQRRDLLPWVDFSSIASWDRIVKWYEKLYEGQAVPSKAVEALTAAVIDGADTDEEKLVRIFDFVSAKIEYEDLDFQYSGYVPQTADSILREGYGDCKDQSVLLISMLNAAGIDSHLVLNTPWYTGENPYLPSPRFSHAIVAVQEEEKVAYLDPTTTDFTFGEVPAGMVGSYVLPITSGGQLSRLEAETKTQRTYYMLELDNLGANANISGSVDYQGISAGRFRANFKDLQQRKTRDVFSMITNTWLPGFELGEWDVRNLDTLKRDPVLNFTGKISGLVTPAGSGTLRLDIPWVDLLDGNVKAWLAASEIRSAIQVTHPVLSTPQLQTVVLHIPSGYRISHLPASAKYSFGDSYVSYSYTGKDDAVIVTREILVENQIVSPEKADDFRNFVRQAVSKETEGIYIRR